MTKPFTIGKLGQKSREKLSDVHRKAYLESNAKEAFSVDALQKHIETIARPEILKRKSHEKAAPLRTLQGLFDFRKEQNLPKCSINQVFNGFKTFQAINYAPNFLFLQLGETF